MEGWEWEREVLIHSEALAKSLPPVTKISKE